MPNPGSISARTSASDSSKINSASANSIGKGSTTPPKPAGYTAITPRTVPPVQGPVFNPAAVRDAVISKAQATLQKNRTKGGVYNSSGTN
jgi:hypothetical protein